MSEENTPARLEKSENQEPDQPLKPEKGKSKKGRGCFIVLIVLLLIIGGGVFTVWRAMNPSPGPIARTLMDTPPDEAATEAVTAALARDGFERGVAAVVLPLPDERGNPSADKGSAVLLALDLSGGFVPAETEESMRRQALDMVTAVVEANRTEGLDINYSGCSFFSDGKRVASLSVPMEAMEAWVEGQISDQQFLAAVQVKAHDIGYYVNLAQEYLDVAIGRAITRAISDVIIWR